MNEERVELQADGQQPTDDRQSWQRPTLKRLQVNLDTASETGNGGDAFNSTALSAE